MVLESWDDELFRQIRPSVEMDFDRSILLWHIAADICYHADDQRKNSSSKLLDSKCDEFMKNKLLKSSNKHSNLSEGSTQA